MILLFVSGMNSVTDSDVPKAVPEDVGFEPTPGSWNLLNETGFPLATMALDPSKEVYSDEAPDLQIKLYNVKESLPNEGFKELQVTGVPCEEPLYPAEVLNDPPGLVGDPTPFSGSEDYDDAEVVAGVFGDGAVEEAAVSKDPPLLEGTGIHEHEELRDDQIVLQARPQNTLTARADDIQEERQVPNGTDSSIVYVEEYGEIVDLWIDLVNNTSRYCAKYMFL
jgi:hypothetical protein